MKLMKSKLLPAMAAVATAAVVLLSGTFAWQNLNQEVTSYASGTANPGGRLHEDFTNIDGSQTRFNKDIYVENFAEEPIFARIQLTEYFEIGTDAGMDVGTDSGRDVNIITNDWSVHKFGAANATDSYWKWKTGGQTVYMPTFNKNKDSLEADVNGTYAGPDGLSTGENADRYQDYKAYKAGDTVVGNEIYDADTNDIDEGVSAAEGINITTVSGQTHTAKETQTAPSVKSMEEWKALAAEEKTGPFWVYDDDGWVYWAQPLAAGHATGLLLDEIALTGAVSDNWYYAVNVTAQFITADNLGYGTTDTGFYNQEKGTAPSEEALALLKAIGVSVGNRNIDLRITAEDEVTGVLLGGTASFSVQPAGTAVIWSLDKLNRNVTKTNIDTDGKLTIGWDETADYIRVVAAASDEGVLGSADYTVNIRYPKIAVSASENAATLKEGETITLTADNPLKGNDNMTGAVTWSIDGSGLVLTETAEGSCSIFIDPNATEISAQWTITVTADENERVAGSYTLTKGEIDSISIMDANGNAIENNTISVESLGTDLTFTTNTENITWTLGGKKSGNTIWNDNTKVLTIAEDETGTFNEAPQRYELTLTAKLTSNENVTATVTIILPEAEETQEVVILGDTEVSAGDSIIYTLSNANEDIYTWNITKEDDVDISIDSVEGTVVIGQSVPSNTVFIIYVTQTVNGEEQQVAYLEVTVVNASESASGLTIVGDAVISVPSNVEEGIPTTYIAYYHGAQAYHTTWSFKDDFENDYIMLTSEDQGVGKLSIMRGLEVEESIVFTIVATSSVENDEGDDEIITQEYTVTIVPQVQT